jgi:hypothetical protein
LNKNFAIVTNNNIKKQLGGAGHYIVTYMDVYLIILKKIFLFRRREVDDLMDKPVVKQGYWRIVTE